MLVDEGTLMWLPVDCADCGRDGLWCPSSRLVWHRDDTVCELPQPAPRTVWVEVPAVAA